MGIFFIDECEEFLCLKTAFDRTGYVWTRVVVGELLLRTNLWPITACDWGLDLRFTGVQVFFIVIFFFLTPDQLVRNARVHTFCTRTVDIYDHYCVYDEKLAMFDRHTPAPARGLSWINVRESLKKKKIDKQKGNVWNVWRLSAYSARTIPFPVYVCNF